MRLFFSSRILNRVVFDRSETLHVHSETLLRLGQVYKQINAPFGQLAHSALMVSTHALESNDPGDSTYTQLESQIAS